MGTMAEKTIEYAEHSKNYLRYYFYLRACIFQFILNIVEIKNNANNRDNQNL